MRQCMDHENLHSRLSKIAGQIKAIEKMWGRGRFLRECRFKSRRQKRAIKWGKSSWKGIQPLRAGGIEHGRRQDHRRFCQSRGCIFRRI
jgi:hypothetical protein